MVLLQHQAWGVVVLPTQVAFRTESGQLAWTVQRVVERQLLRQVLRRTNRGAKLTPPMEACSLSSDLFEYC